MRKHLLLLLAFISLFGSAARADWTGKDASTATITFKNAGVCSSVVCVPQTAMTDSTGTVFVAVPTVGADAASNTASGLLAYARNLIFNGTTWDRWQGAVTQPTASLLNNTEANSAAILAGITSSIPAGAALIGKVGIDQTTPGTTNAVSATGNVGTLATDSGNPVKTGCVFNTTLPTATDGQRVDTQCDTKGHTRVAIASDGGATVQGFATAGADAVSNTSSGMVVYERPTLFNGSTWDRAFTCPNVANVNVTAGSTTQIVGLVAAQVIRVCSIAVSMSASGTFSILSGTGTNCGTPAGATTAMTLNTGNPLNLVAPVGGSIYRSTSAGEICIAAVTGNVTGWITYAQF